MQNFNFAEMGTLSWFSSLGGQRQSRGSYTDIPTMDEALTQPDAASLAQHYCLCFELALCFKRCQGYIFALKPKDVLKTLFTEIVLVITLFTHVFVHFCMLIYE